MAELSLIFLKHTRLRAEHLGAAERKDVPEDEG